FGSVVAALLVLVLSSSGCGYALAGRGSFLPTDIRVVAIPPLVNRTTFFDVEQILTEKVRNEFIGRGKYKIVSDAPGADAVLNASGTANGQVEAATFIDQQRSTFDRIATDVARTVVTAIVEAF